ncbi:DUF4294 domain-containing protein [uncultured Muribaculum sp.]|uniref:DUF4294 domain-containing protein n=2 Tax=uncultured Muribaculum sp. TaxID=1918613 RepID=UPI0025B00B6F|nr:DUF4294 domain-containing protein [uncultured Muribaculum sp.]
MFRRFMICMCAVFAAFVPVTVSAQAFDDDEALVDALSVGLERVPEARQKFMRGRYHFVTEQGDTALMVVLNNITVYPPMRFKNKKQEKFYWRTVRDVKRTLPYAKLIAETLLETYEYIETFPTQKEREEYLARMEKEIFKQYKPVLKRFTKSQGQMLVKLINRETNQSSYNIIKAFLGSFRAGFWQTFGHFFGVNLKTGYKPDKDDKDAVIERVCVLVEQGML